MTTILQNYPRLLICLCLLLSACSTEPAYDLTFSGTPTELVADVTDFKKNFGIKISDVHRELERLKATTLAESAGQQADTLLMIADSTGTAVDSSEEKRKAALATTNSTALSEKRATIHQLQSQLSELAHDLTKLDVDSDSAYLSNRINLEDGLNQIVTRIERMWLIAIENPIDFEQSIDARLHELNLELMDMERRIGGVDSLLQDDYKLIQRELRGRHDDLKEAFDTLPSATPEEFMARRISMTEYITTLGADIRATSNEVLRLTSGSWKVRQPATM